MKSRRIPLAIIIAGGIAAAGFTVVAFTDMLSAGRLDRRYRITTAETIQTSANAATIARGKHLALDVVNCAECHGEDLGGKITINSPMVMRVAPPNLTTGRGGVGDLLGVTDWERAIRHGVAPDGRPLILMPSISYVNLGDPDVEAIITWAKSLPTVDRTLPATRLGPIGHFMHATKLYPVADAELIPTNATHPVEPAPGRTPEYGKYFTTIAGCTDCHYADLRGGRVRGAPANWPDAPNLTPGGTLAETNEAQFISALRTFKRPNGTAIDSAMPRRYARLTDDEMASIYAYLRTLPALPTPKR